MRMVLSFVAVAALSHSFVTPVRADSSATTPQEFAYTEIYTALSDAGIPVHTEVKRVTVSGPHKRVDRFQGPFEVTDALTRRMVSIDPKRKTFTVHEQERVMNISDGSQTEVDIPKRPAHDYYTALTRMPDGATRVELKGEVSIQGQPARGQQFTHVSAKGTNITTVWAAVGSKRVVQVKSTWTPCGATSNQVVIIRTAFDYSPVSDRSMFSLVPPSGYEVKSQPILGLTSQRD